jgi:hypothetical protein
MLPFMTIKHHEGLHAIITLCKMQLVEVVELAISTLEVFCVF